MGRMDHVGLGYDYVRDREGGYYSQLHQSEDIQRAISNRDAGWGKFQDGEREEGLDLLRDSVDTLSFSELSRPWCSRETYASLSRLAQAQCVVGQFSDAAYLARVALTQTPPRIARYGNLIRGRNEPNPDQYEVIFSGRLSIVLATSEFEGDLARSMALANKARRLARISERRDMVAFTNKEMSTEDREETRSRFGQLAWGATILSFGGTPWPLQVRRRVAQKVLAK